jgi:hypothetical protein
MARRDWPLGRLALRGEGEFPRRTLLVAGILPRRLSRLKGFSLQAEKHRRRAVRPSPMPSVHGSLAYDGTALGAHWATSNVCPDCITHEVSPRLSPEHVQPAGALGVVVVVLNTETASGQPVL